MLGRLSLLRRAPVTDGLFGIAGSFETATSTTIHARWKMKKASGSCRQGGNNAGKRLGKKKSNNEFVKPGDNIFLQRGMKILPGPGTAMAKDQRIYALQMGLVKFTRIKEGSKARRQQISVVDPPPDYLKALDYKRKLRLNEERRKASALKMEEREKRGEIVPEYAMQMSLHFKHIEQYLETDTDNKQKTRVFFV